MIAPENRSIITSGFSQQQKLQQPQHQHDTNDDDGDAFWEVAFMTPGDDDNIEANEGQYMTTNDDAAKLLRYVLPTHTTTTTVGGGYGDKDNDNDNGGHEQQNQQEENVKAASPAAGVGDVVLELESLPATDGIWSPVGADAWYASALLTSLLLSPLPPPLPPPPPPFQERGNRTTTSTITTITMTTMTTTVKDDQEHRCTAVARHPFSSLMENASSEQKRRSDGDTTTTSTSTSNTTTTNIILELGSGAVGLSGLGSAVALHRFLASAPCTSTSTSTSTFTPHWKVILTDNDPSVLEQLQRNVKRNQSKLLVVGESSSSADASIHVAYLNWGEDEGSTDNDNEEGVPCTSLVSSLLRSTYNDKNDDENDDSDININKENDDCEIRLVIGSELVYTQDTADACVQILTRLLRDHPRVEIWIVQVKDRYGWSEVVLPALQGLGGIQVESIPLSVGLHAMAATMIPIGGTLDQQAYGCVCIRNDISW